MISLSSTKTEQSPIKLTFSWGFRPFFLGAGVYAALAMLAWLSWIGIHAAGGALTYISIAEAPHLWHAHEMVYGFASAAVAGFLLTAVPNWTGAERYQGRPLMILFALWLAGRLAMWLTTHLPVGVVAVIDVAFLPALALSATLQLLVRPALRNLMFVGLLGLLTTGNVIFHLGRTGAMPGGESDGVRLGLLTLILMIGIVGGRIVPAFTHNALNKQGIRDGMPKRFALLDSASLFLIVLFVVASTTGAPGKLTGALGLLAGGVNAVRATFWRPDRVLGEPILWVLHLGYAWLVAGLLLAGIAAISDVVGEIAALHAFGTGAVGTMILAVMSRASLGHTGRPLVAAPAMTVAYLMVTLAAVMRVFAAAVVPDFYNEVMLLAGLTWIGAFGIFSVVYAPMLTGPRVNMKVRRS